MTVDKRPRKKKTTTAVAKPAKATHATATFRKPYATDADRITACTEQTAAMTAGPGWATATDLQKACAAWSATTASIQSTGITVEGLRAQRP